MTVKTRAIALRTWWLQVIYKLIAVHLSNLVGTARRYLLDSQSCELALEVSELLGKLDFGFAAELKGLYVGRL